MAKSKFQVLECLADIACDTLDKAARGLMPISGDRLIINETRQAVKNLANLSLANKSLAYLPCAMTFVMKYSLWYGLYQLISK